MIFGIDVREEICKTDRTFIKIVELKTEIESLLKEADDEDLCMYLNNARVEMKNALNRHRDIYREKVKEFEKKFVKEVLEEKDFYKMEIEE